MDRKIRIRLGHHTSDPTAAAAERQVDERRVGVLAALLNLSGLGLGFLYLRRWGLAALHMGLLAPWVAWASTPGWIFLLVVLVAGSVFAAWRSPRRGPTVPPEKIVMTAYQGGRRVHTLVANPNRTPVPRPPVRVLTRSTWLPLVVAVVAVAAVAVIVATYRSGAADALAAGNEAHAEGDCDEANRHYDRVTGHYGRSLTPAIDDAENGRAACRTLEDAREHADAGELTTAVLDYQDYRDLPGALYAEGAGAELATVRATLAEELLGSTGGSETERITAAYEQYVLLVEQHAGSPEADGAPAAVRAMYDGAIARAAETSACDQVELLYHFVDEFPGDDGLSDGFVTDAQARLPGAEEACELQRITDEIADLRDRAGELPPPTPVGSAAPGTVTVEVVNGSSEPLEVLYEGPQTGRVTVDPCPDCGGGSFFELDCGTANSPRQTFTLAPGAYEVVVKAIGDQSVSPFYGAWNLPDGTAYSACFYIRTTFG